MSGSRAVAPELEVVARPEGLYLPSVDLFLDPRSEVPRAFVSHAHADHFPAASPSNAKAGSWVVSSADTASLLAVRWGRRAGGAAMPERHLQSLAWGESFDLPLLLGGGGHARLSVTPAGHILGAAQLVVDTAAGRLVYTGDYRSGPGATHDPGRPVLCDALVIESTFALPIFRFPAREQVTSELVLWCQARLASGEVPVVLAYALGKAQEVIAALVAAGVKVVAHGSVFAMCEAYEALGRPLGVAAGQVTPYLEAKRRGAIDGVLVVPPRSSSMLKKIAKARVAYVSGWALLDGAVEQQRADAAFPLSDHADSDDLLETVGASGARRVYTTYGDAAPFASLLEERGIAATPLDLPPLDERNDAEGALAAEGP